MTDDRFSVVEHLIAAGLEGMEGLNEPYTDQELLSAAFSLALRVLVAACHTNPTIRPLARAGAQILLMQCADGKPN